jgi:hypothetical protein
MRFAFQLSTGNALEIHARTGTLALRKLLAWSRSGHCIRFAMKEIALCGISQDDYEYSHSNDEMLRAGETIVNYFWDKLSRGVDAEVHVEEDN